MGLPSKILPVLMDWANILDLLVLLLLYFFFFSYFGYLFKYLVQHYKDWYLLL